MFEWILNGGGVPEIFPGFQLVKTLTGVPTYGNAVSVSDDGSHFSVGTVKSGTDEHYTWGDVEYTLDQSIPTNVTSGYNRHVRGGDVFVSFRSFNSTGLVIYRRVADSYVEVQRIGNVERPTLSGDGSILLAYSFTERTIRVYNKQGDGTFTLKQSITAPTLRGFSNGEVCISGDGTVIAVGGYNYGELYVYKVAAGGNFTYQQTLTGSKQFGISTSLSFDGGVLVVGNQSGGEATLYTYTGSKYVEIYPTLSGSSYFGTLVLLNGSGTLLIVSAYASNSVYVYELDGGVATLVQTMIYDKNFGNDIDLSSDGLSMIVTSDTGMVRLFRRNV